ncbi:MAG: RHS repeat-associated core domain-containing protein, partial [Phycisphaerae bacterium]
DDRFRNYSPTLGRWTSQDPLGYINGANTYQFVDSSPVGNVDAAGLYKLPGVQAPVLVRTGKKHAMSGGRYYVNYYYAQDLGVVVTSGESPRHLLLFKLTEEILHGLTKLSGIGGIIAKIANSITDNGDYTIPWKGSAFPEITTVYFCNGKVQSVTPKEWGNTRWEWDTSLHGQMGGGFIIKGWQGQDREFFKSLVETTKELIKSAGGE